MADACNLYQNTLGGMTIWVGVTNGEAVTWATDTDIIPTVRPFVDETRIGVQLIDDAGEVLASSWRLW